VELKYWPLRWQYFSVVQSSAGVFSASKGEVALTPTVVGASGQIRTSLWESLSKQGVPPEMIIRFAELFSWRIDFLTEPRAGDTYQLVWRRGQGPGVIRDDDILCAAYNSHERGSLLAYALKDDFYDAHGDSLRGEFLRAPLAYRRITSYFTEKRFHPILRIYRPHHGIDYAAPYGTPASSIADGVVIEKGWGGGIGNQLRVRHAGSYVSIYGHLSRYASDIHVGSHVKQGQVIGYVGSTGLSTGPHLHFGFEQGGKLINFFSLKQSESRHSVPSPERAHFNDLKGQADAYLAHLKTVDGPLQTLAPLSNP
jgi:murein DD-endopeptidase MepM/ murein hydrolase activator NlpD